MVCQNCSAQIQSETATCTSCGFHPKSINLIAGPKKMKSSALAAGAAASFLILIAAASFFVIIPRAGEISFLSETKQTLAETSDKTAKVNRSLESIYSFVTGSQNTTSESSFQSSQANPQAGVVAGIESSISDANDDIVPQAEISLLLLKENLDEAVSSLVNKNVKAFSTPSNDPMKAYRDLRDLADNAKESTNAGYDALGKLTSTLKERSPSASLALDQTLRQVASSTEKYLSEARRTANYYETFTDIYIDFTSVLVDGLSTTNIKQLKDDLARAKEIEATMNSISQGSLPEELAPFHAVLEEELAGAVEFLNTYATLAQSSDTSVGESATAAAQDWLQKEKSLAIKMQITQTNFWKKNSTLGSFSHLSNDQSDLLKDLGNKSKNTKLLFII